MPSLSKDAEIAVLQTQMDQVKQTGDRTEAKVDKLLDRFEITVASFATKVELDAIVADIKKEFDDKVDNARKFNWLTHTMTAILTAFLIAIAYWIISQLTHH